MLPSLQSSDGFGVSVSITKFSPFDYRQRQMSLFNLFAGTRGRHHSVSVTRDADARVVETHDDTDELLPSRRDNVSTVKLFCISVHINSQLLRLAAMPWFS
jgi:hypothetical protein